METGAISSGGITPHVDALSLLDDAPRERPSCPRRIGRALKWLAIGAALTLLVSWGCVLWRVYVAMPLLGASAAGLPARLDWPFDAGRGWASPDTAELSEGFGYRRIQASGSQIRLEDGSWASVYARRAHYRAKRDRIEGEFRRKLQELRDSRREGDDPGAERQLAEETLRVIREELEFEDLHGGRSQQSRMLVFHRASGWPMLSMQSRFALFTPATPTFSAPGPEYVVGEEFSVAGAQRMSPRQFFDRGLSWPTQTFPSPSTQFTLPLRPVWPGFAINAVFWGGAAAGLSHWVRSIREKRRLREGQCAGCRYQVNDLPVCPECGRVQSDGTEAHGMG